MTECCLCRRIHCNECVDEFGRCVECPKQESSKDLLVTRSSSCVPFPEGQGGKLFVSSGGSRLFGFVLAESCVKILRVLLRFVDSIEALQKLAVKPAEKHTIKTDRDGYSSHDQGFCDFRSGQDTLMEKPMGHHHIEHFEALMNFH